MTKSLCRLSLIKSDAYLGLESTTYDSELKQLLVASSQLFEKMTGRQFVQTVNVETRQGSGGRLLFMRQYPVTQLVSVDIWDGNEWVAQDLDDFEIVESGYAIEYPAKGRESYASYGAWRIGEGYNRVTYRSGYAVDDWETAPLNLAWTVPQDIENAICERAAIQWKKGIAGGGRIGVISQTRLQESITVDKFSTGEPDVFVEAVENYARIM